MTKCNRCKVKPKVRDLRFCDGCANFIIKALREKESYGDIYVRGIGGRRVKIQ